MDSGLEIHGLFLYMGDLNLDWFYMSSGLGFGFLLRYWHIGDYIIHWFRMLETI